MTDREQVEAFTGDLQAVVARYVAEFNLSTAAAVGCLEIVKASILHNVFAEDDDDGETFVK